MYQHLLFSVKDGIATISLNRPDYFNALNTLLKQELLQAFTETQKDSSVKVVVLTGEGKAFCSGQDLKEAMNELQGKSYAEQIRTYYNPLILAMRNLPKPIICQLQGMAAGAGCSLALACDLIIAADTAAIAELFVGIGLVMDSGSGYFLPRAVGPYKAFELATMGTKVGAHEALALGLVNKVVPADQLAQTTRGIAQYYTHAPAKAIGLMKQMLHQSDAMSLEEMLDYEAELQEIAGASEDHREGVKAFLEKRPPVFTGK